jgi:hypothetical protein
MFTALREGSMTDRHQARLTYLSKVRSATVRLWADTEKGLRKLPGISDAELAKLIAAVEKRHAKMLKKIDTQITHEKRRVA